MTNKHKPDAEVTQFAWQKHEMEQLMYFRSLSLRNKLEAVEGMADVVRHFQKLRSEGKFTESQETATNKQK